MLKPALGAMSEVKVGVDAVLPHIPFGSAMGGEKHVRVAVDFVAVVWVHLAVHVLSSLVLIWS